MKFNKTLLIISMVLISLFAIGAVSASDSDNATDIMEISAVDEEIETIDVNQDMEEVLSVDEGNSSVVDVNINVEDVTVEVYEKATIPINVTDKDGKAVSGGAVVTILWQGDSLSKYVDVVDGKADATFDFTDVIGIMSSMSMGDMMSMFGGSGTGGMDWASMFSGNMTMEDMMNMFGGNGTSGNGTGGMNWAEMFGGNGTGGMNWAEMFSGNGSGNMMEGMVSVSYEYIFTPGKYNVTTIFIGDGNYNRTNATSNLIITYKEDVVYFAEITTPQKLGDKTVVNITVVDKYGNPIPNVVVNAVLDGTQDVNATLNENGTASITFENLVKGDHKLVLQSKANGTLTSKGFDFYVDVIKSNATIEVKDVSVTTVDVNVDGKIGKYFSATLKDELGNPISNQNVQISINNEKSTVTTDKDGVAKLQLNIAKAGTYTCTVALLGDDVYNGAFEIAKVTVNKQTPKLTTAKKTYKASAKTKKLTATFKSAKGKAIKGKKITFKVKGKTYTAKTNSKGVATVNVKLAKKGTYTFTAKFAGDSTYKAVSKSAKLILK